MPLPLRSLNRVKNYAPPFNVFLRVYIEGSLEPDVISPEPVDGFLKFKRRLEAERILHYLYRIDF